MLHRLLPATCWHGDGQSRTADDNRLAFLSRRLAGVGPGRISQNKNHACVIPTAQILLISGRVHTNLKTFGFCPLAFILYQHSCKLRSRYLIKYNSTKFCYIVLDYNYYTLLGSLRKEHWITISKSIITRPKLSLCRPRTRRANTE